MKMKTQIITILAIMLSIPFVFGMIAGESETVEFNGKVSECYISDGISNLSDYNLDGLSFNESANKVTIYTNPLLAPGNLTISCLVQGFREEQSSSGGSSGGGGYVKDWSAKCGYNKTCLYGKDLNTTIINQTEINQTINETIDVTPEEPEKISLFRRFLNWLKRIFGR